MLRINSANNTAVLPAPLADVNAPGFFVNNPGAGPGTVLSGDWANRVQEEIVAPDPGRRHSPGRQQERPASGGAAADPRLPGLPRQRQLHRPGWHHQGHVPGMGRRRCRRRHLERRRRRRRRLRPEALHGDARADDRRHGLAPGALPDHRPSPEERHRSERSAQPPVAPIGQDAVPAALAVSASAGISICKARPAASVLPPAFPAQGGALRSAAAA